MFSGHIRRHPQIDAIGHSSSGGHGVHGGSGPISVGELTYNHVVLHRFNSGSSTQSGSPGLFTPQMIGFRGSSSDLSDFSPQNTHHTQESIFTRRDSEMSIDTDTDASIYVMQNSISRSTSLNSVFSDWNDSEFNSPSPESFGLGKRMDSTLSGWYEEIEPFENIHQLPTDVIREVLKYLEPEMLKPLFLANKFWNHLLLSDDNLWIYYNQFYEQHVCTPSCYEMLSPDLKDCLATYKHISSASSNIQKMEALVNRKRYNFLIIGSLLLQARYDDGFMSPKRVLQKLHQRTGWKAFELKEVHSTEHNTSMFTTEGCHVVARVRITSFDEKRVRARGTIDFYQTGDETEESITQVALKFDHCCSQAALDAIAGFHNSPTLLFKGFVQVEGYMTIKVQRHRWQWRPTISVRRIHIVENIERRVKELTSFAKEPFLFQQLFRGTFMQCTGLYQCGSNRHPSILCMVTGQPVTVKLSRKNIEEKVVPVVEDKKYLITPGELYSLSNNSNVEIIGRMRKFRKSKVVLVHPQSILVMGSRPRYLGLKISVVSIVITIILQMVTVGLWIAYHNKHTVSAFAVITGVLTLITVCLLVKLIFIDMMFLWRRLPKYMGDRKVLPM